MGTAALYIGYAILVILGLALIALAFFTLWLTAAGICRIVTTKQTIRFMRRAEAKAINDGCKCAYEYLIKHGLKDKDTLGEVARQIELHRKINKI